MLQLANGGFHRIAKPLDGQARIAMGAAHRLGYDAIEPRIDSDHAHGIQVQTPASQRAELRRQLDDAPVRVGCLATSVRFATVRA